MNAFRPIGRWCLRRGFDGAGDAIRVLPLASSGREDVAATTKVFDESQLQRAGPRPDFADGQRTDRLEAAMNRDRRCASRWPALERISSRAKA